MKNLILLCPVGLEQVLGSDLVVRYLILNTSGIRSAVVLASLKDDIDRFEARHMMKKQKNYVAMENLVSS